MSLFYRVCKLTVGEAGGQGFSTSTLRVHFSIDKDPTSQTNKSKISVYNLAPATIDRFIKEDQVVILEAGYELDKGLIRMFSGTVAHATNRVERTDVITELDVHDGLVPIRDSIASVGYTGGVNGRQVAADLIGTMGLTAKIAPDVAFANYPNGFSFCGYSREALDKVCAAAELNWSIQNGVLQITKEGGTTGVMAPLISAQTGMIGSPERIIKAASQAATKPGKPRKTRHEKKAGWRVKSLLLPGINPGDYVAVKSLTTKDTSGWFTIEVVKHDGDTRGQQFMTTLDLIEVMA